MPLYGTPQAGGQLTSVIPGDSFTLFAATDSLTALQASIAFSRGYSPSADDAGSTFQWYFASSPTAVVEVLGTNTPQAPGQTFNVNQWAVLYTSTNKQFDGYTDTARYAFYCMYLVSQSGGGVLVGVVQR